MGGGALLGCPLLGGIGGGPPEGKLSVELYPCVTTPEAPEVEASTELKLVTGGTESWPSDG